MVPGVPTAFASIKAASPLPIPDPVRSFKNLASSSISSFFVLAVKILSSILVLPLPSPFLTTLSTISIKSAPHLYLLMLFVHFYLH